MVTNNVTENKAGVWPVMLTPFTETGEVDYDSLGRLVEWYEENGAAGLFAVCQSSEVFFLSLEERVKIAEYVCRKARIPVIASGHISYGMADQEEELKRIAETGVAAVVLITNRMAAEYEAPEAWRARLEKLMKALPQSMPLGFYECPYPYKRLLSDEEIAFSAGTGRFQFLKDTCCDLAVIQRRLGILKGTPLKLFNANTATLLDSLRSGGAGFSGVMANFHPELYAWLCENWEVYPKEAEELQAALTMCSFIEKQLYPTNAKHYLKEKGILSSDYCRTQDHTQMSPLFCDEVKQMERVVQFVEKALPNFSK